MLVAGFFLLTRLALFGAMPSCIGLYGVTCTFRAYVVFVYWLGYSNGVEQMSFTDHSFSPGFQFKGADCMYVLH